MIERMDNVGIVVDDLDAAVAFFTELGLELEGEAQIEGRWADRAVGLDGVRSDIAMMRTPDGHSKLELTKFHTPTAAGAEPENPPPTRWACIASCSPSKTSRTSLLACALTAPNSSVTWRSTRTATLTAWFDVIVYVTVIRLPEYTGRNLAGYLDIQFWLGDEPGGVGDIVFALVERTEKVLGLLDE